MTPDASRGTDLASGHEATGPVGHPIEQEDPMTRSVVDTERIAAAAADINRLADSITSSAAELRGRLAGLGGDWQGPAKAEFERVMADYQRVQAQMTESLADVGRLTLKASRAYAEHETATRALFAR
jgi:WXG100 family type VII secretion target